MSKKALPKKNVEEDEDDDDVRLKSFLGIKPGYYLACLYGAVILLVLFFILLYPGLSKPGSVLKVATEPHGAAVLVDGVYMEAAPCEIFVPKGSRSIELNLPGFLPIQTEKQIEGRTFASIFFPLKVEINEKLEARYPAQAFIDYAAEYASWSFTGEPTAAYQIPLSLSEGAYRLGPGAADPAVLQSLKDTVAASARFAVTRAGLRDLIRAKTLVDNQGLSPSPLSLLHSAGDIINFLDNNPGAAAWLGSLLSGEAQSVLTSSTWYKTDPGSQNEGGSAGGSIQVMSLDFRMINGGTVPGINFPPETKVDTFYICETIISSPLWERFLAERPRWQIDNITELTGEGLVTEDYLLKADLNGAPAEGVTGISWYAAKAFCEWLSSFLPPQYSSMEVRLPSEAEWEYAAKSGILAYGDYWEWCEDPYVPLSFLTVPQKAAQALGSPEKSLRGGAWINSARSVGPETRASLPPSFCTAFVSARPVIAPKRD